MNCEMTTSCLDDFLDAALPPHVGGDIARHVKGCPSCRGVIEREQALREALRRLPVPAPDREFSARTLRRAGQHHQQRKAVTRRWAFGLGGAAAAGLAMFLAASVMLPQPGDRPADLSVVTVALEQPRNVRVVMNATENLDNATFTVSLPPNLELDGFPGQQVITWDGRLGQGRNLLVLPVIARGPVAGELTTLLRHGNRQKVFRVHVRMEGYIGSPDSERMKLMM